MSDKVIEINNSEFIEEIKKANKEGKKLPWQKTWVSGLPVNYVTRRPYRGVNLLKLPDDTSEFVTMKQYRDLKKKNPNIKLNPKPTKYKVIFYVKKYFSFKEEEDGEEVEKKGYFYKPGSYHEVVGINQIEGLETKFETFDTNPIEEAEKVINNFTQCKIIKDKFSKSAFYSPTKDEITNPMIKQFKVPEEYYSTLFHEMAHSTGHYTRLKRFEKNNHSCFGSSSYSIEELIAEISSYFLMTQLGLSIEFTRQNSIAYVQGWSKKLLEGDMSILEKSAAKAQKAVDYILNNGNIDYSKKDK